MCIKFVNLYHIYITTDCGEIQRLSDSAIEAENSNEALEIWRDAIKDNNNGIFIASGNEYAVLVVNDMEA